MSETVNNPKWYTNHPSGIECIDVTEHFNFNIGNAIKYLWRVDLKNSPIENLEKAKWYVEREIQRRKAYEDKHQTNRSGEDSEVPTNQKDGYYLGKACP